MDYDDWMFLNIKRYFLRINAIAVLLIWSFSTYVFADPLWLFEHAFDGPFERLLYLLVHVIIFAFTWLGLSTPRKYYKEMEQKK